MHDDVFCSARCVRSKPRARPRNIIASSLPTSRLQYIRTYRLYSRLLPLVATGTFALGFLLMRSSMEEGTNKDRIAHSSIVMYRYRRE